MGARVLGGQPTLSLSCSRDQNSCPFARRLPCMSFCRGFNRDHNKGLLAQSRCHITTFSSCPYYFIRPPARVYIDPESWRSRSLNHYIQTPNQSKCIHFTDYVRKLPLQTLFLGSPIAEIIILKFRSTNKSVFLFRQPVAICRLFKSAKCPRKSRLINFRAIIPRIKVV